MVEDEEINIDEIKKQFEEYTSKYDIDNPKILLKVNHIKRVADISEKIATQLNLNDTQIKLAILIGYLHDIGRFEQIKIYNTFLDNKSINHAEQGLKVLYENDKALLRKFIKTDKYDDIIYKAVLNHNKLKEEEDLTKEEKLFSKIIRDADKVDIFRVITTDKLENTTSCDNIEIEKYTISDNIIKQFNSEQLVKYKDINNCLDYMVAWTAYIYDLNYGESLKIIQDNSYIDKIFDMADNANDIAKCQINDIKTKANSYLNFKINELEK